MLNDKATKSDRNENFDEKGKFIKGNVIGRMPKKGFTLTHLNKLVKEFEESKENKKGTLLKHYVRRLYKNDRLLARYMDKNVPTKTINELTGPGGEPIKNIILHKIIYGKGKKGEKNKPGEAESG